MTLMTVTLMTSMTVTLMTGWRDWKMKMTLNDIDP